MKFRATVELGGKTATGMVVPEQVVADLGSSKRPAVRVTINGYMYRSTIAVMGGRFLLPVSAEVREGAGVKAGDVVDVDVELDTAPRELFVPDDFQQALQADADAKRFFDSLSYSNRQRFVLNVEGTKNPETRKRRIESAITKLRAGTL